MTCEAILAEVATVFADAVLWSSAASIALGVAGYVGAQSIHSLVRGFMARRIARLSFAERERRVEVMRARQIERLSRIRARMRREGVE